MHFFLSLWEQEGIFSECSFDLEILRENSTHLFPYQIDSSRIFMENKGKLKTLFLSHSESTVSTRIMNVIAQPHRTQEFEKPVEMTFWPAQVKILICI